MGYSYAAPIYVNIEYSNGQQQPPVAKVLLQEYYI